MKRKIIDYFLCAITITLGVFFYVNYGIAIMISFYVYMILCGIATIINKLDK